MTRGKSVFKVIGPQPKCGSGPPPLTNDFFLYALFARIALSNNDNVEFETKYDKATNTIELIVPNEAMPLFNQITGMKRGPKFQCFIDWLIGSLTLQKSFLDSDFVASGALDIWFGGTVSTINEKLVILLPTSDASVIGYNLKTNDTFNGSMDVSLVWMYICGSNTKFDIRASSSVTAADGTAVVTVDDTEISTFNLVEGDIRETPILHVDNVTNSNIISLLLNRNWAGSADPMTESIGIVGIKAVLNSNG